MKFTCHKNVILKEIAIAQDIISSRNSLSILSNVLLEADNETLKIKATDLKVSFETQIPVEVSQAGSTTVFCDKFLGIIRSLPDGDVEFNLADGRLLINPLFGKINFQLKSISSDKFPEIKEIGDDKYFELPQNSLIDMISHTVFSVSDDETRYFMNGVYLEHQEGTLSMVATDGRRLSFIKKDLSTEIKDFDPVIIPTKILHLIKKLSSKEGNLYLAVSDKSIFVKFDNQKISSNLIEGQFPNYKRVIPEHQEFNINVNKNDLIEALRRVSLLIEQKSRRLYMTFSTGTITLNSEESEIGIAKEEINCDYEGDGLTVALNYLYLLEPLKVIEEEEITIKFTEANKAISIISVPEKDYFHIVMPMQLD